MKAIVALCLLALPLLNSTSAQVPLPDFTVSNVALLGSAPSWVSGKATPDRVYFDATVENLGPVGASYRIDFCWQDSQGDCNPLNGAQQNSFDIGTLPGAQSNQAPPENIHHLY